MRTLLKVSLEHSYFHARNVFAPKAPLTFWLIRTGNTAHCGREVLKLQNRLLGFDFLSKLGFGSLLELEFEANSAELKARFFNRTRREVREDVDSTLKKIGTNKATDGAVPIFRVVHVVPVENCPPPSRTRLILSFTLVKLMLKIA